MAITQYSPIPDQQVIRKYEPQDFRYLIAGGEQKQRGYDEGQAFDQQQEGTFAKHQVRNADIARRDQLHDEYLGKAQALVQDQYQGDYGAAMPALRKLANGYAGNEFWNRATSALDREKEDYKTRAELRKKSQNILDFAPGLSQKAIYNQDGSYNDIEYNTQGQSDWVKARKEAIGKIEASGHSSGLSGSGVAGLMRHIDSEGVGASDVQRVALNNFRGYLNGSDGQQEYQYLRARGYGDKDAQKEVLANLVGSGSNQIHSKSKAGYIGDPGYDKEAGKVKDTSTLSIGQTSAAVDVERLTGLDAGAFVRKDRGQAGELLYSGQQGKEAEEFYKRHPQGKQIYGSMDQTQRNKAADLIQAMYPKYAEKLRAGTISEQGMDVIAPAIAKRIKALGNLKVGAAVNMIAPDRDYGSYGKGEEGLTKALLGTDKLDNIPSGKLIGTTIYTPDGKTLSGKDFIEQVWKPAQKAAKDGKMDGTARITGEFGAANPYSLLTNNEAFGDAKQLTIGGEQYVISGLDEKENHTVSQRAQDGTQRDASYVRDLSGIRRAKAAPITKAMRNTGVAIPVTLGNAKFRLKWNEDGSFTFPDHLVPDPQNPGKKIPLVTDDPEHTLDFYLKNGPPK